MTVDGQYVQYHVELSYSSTLQNVFSTGRLHAPTHTLEIDISNFGNLYFWTYFQVH